RNDVPAPRTSAPARTDQTRGPGTKKAAPPTVSTQPASIVVGTPRRLASSPPGRSVSTPTPVKAAMTIPTPSDPRPAARAAVGRNSSSAVFTPKNSPASAMNRPVPPRPPAAGAVKPGGPPRGGGSPG